LIQRFFCWVSAAVAFLPFPLHGQEVSDSSSKGAWKFNAYAESFFCVRQRLETGQNISDFQFNHNRGNIIGLNQVSQGVEYLSKDFRFNLALHTGTYVEDNYAAEPAYLQPINRAYVGYRVSKKRNVWLDAGVFPSYIGFESVNAFDNATATRSLLAENSPYFLTGIRANYPISPKNEFNFYVLTGWQRIKPQNNNSLPSFGWQWIHAFPNQSKFNWSFWAGADHPDSSRKWRYFNNFYWQGKKGKWSYTVGFDIGMEQEKKTAKSFFIWYSPVLITQYSISNKWRSAFRIEHYADPHSVITKPANGSAVRASSQSINVDYSPRPSILCRVEWRSLQAKEPVFFQRDKYANKTSYTTLTIAYQLNANLRKRSHQSLKIGNDKQ
jgi:hypothetical protein